VFHQPPPIVPPLPPNLKVSLQACKLVAGRHPGEVSVEEFACGSGLRASSGFFAVMGSRPILQCCGWPTMSGH